MLAAAKSMNTVPPIAKTEGKSVRVRKPSRQKPQHEANASGDGVSRDLAALVELWKRKYRVAMDAMVAADVPNPSKDLVYQMEIANPAEQLLLGTIINHKATSFADVLAKFSVIKSDVDEEDYVALMNGCKHNHMIERMMWSIAGDLADLPETLPATTVIQVDCPAAAVADQFRKTIDRFTAVDQAHGAVKDELRQILHRHENLLKEAVSFERATTAKGALFQLGVVLTLVNVLRDPSQEECDLKQAEEDIHRLMFSAICALATITGVAKLEYAGDYFLGPDPFVKLEG